VALIFIDFFFGMSVGGYHAVGKPEDKRAADKDYEIGGKKGHDKDKRVIEIIGRYEQMDAIIQKKCAYKYQYRLSDPPENNRHKRLSNIFLIVTFILIYHLKLARLIPVSMY
jgi:hypothetical protein